MSGNIESCTCNSCVRACKSFPGWFAPGEAEIAAELLWMPWDDFRKKLIKDSCDNDRASNAPWVYSPRKIGVDEDYDEFRAPYKKWLHGVCVFLKDDRCSIHKAKPYECKNALCCDPQKEGTRNEIEQLWIDAGASLGMREE